MLYACSFTGPLGVASISSLKAQGRCLYLFSDIAQSLESDWHGIVTELFTVSMTMRKHILYLYKSPTPPPPSESQFSHFLSCKSHLRLSHSSTLPSPFLPAHSLVPWSSLVTKALSLGSSAPHHSSPWFPSLPSSQVPVSDPAFLLTPGCSTLYSCVLTTPRLQGTLALLLPSFPPEAWAPKLSPLVLRGLRCEGASATNATAASTVNANELPNDFTSITCIRDWL